MDPIRPSTRKPRARAWACFAALAAALGCGPDPGAPSGPGVLFHADDARFDFESAEVPAEGGEAAGSGSRRLLARLTPRGVYHLSTDYPVRLEAHGAGLGLERERWTREHADNLSEERLEFRLGLAPTTEGPLALEGTLRFGICQADEVCEVVSQSFVARVP